jgi:hypothetical protein
VLQEFHGEALASFVERSRTAPETGVEKVGNATHSVTSSAAQCYSVLLCWSALRAVEFIDQRWKVYRHTLLPFSGLDRGGKRAKNMTVFRTTNLNSLPPRRRASPAQRRIGFQMLVDPLMKGSFLAHSRTSSI